MQPQFPPCLLSISGYKLRLVGPRLISILSTFICLMIAKLPGHLKYNNVQLQELSKELCKLPN